MTQRLLLFSFLLLVSIASFSQEPFSKGHRLWCEQQAYFGGIHLDPKESATNAAKSAAFRVPVDQKVQWDWVEVGPNVKPIEHNYGGKAIPNYSRYRGNGTGRINYVYPDPYREDRIFACSPTGGLFVTEDYGESWRNAGTDQLPISGVSSITVHPSDPQTWVISTGDGDDKFMFTDGIWRTQDGGVSYQQINGKRANKAILPSEIPSGWMYLSKVQAHPCDFNRIFVTSSEGLFVTNNALDEVDKVRWHRMHSDPCYDILVHPVHENIVFSGGKELWLSTDCGVSWSNKGAPDYPKKGDYPYLRMTLQASSGEVPIYAGLSCSEKLSQSGLGEGTLWKYDLETDQWQFIRSLRKSMNNLITTRARAFAVHPENSNWLITGNVQPPFISQDGGQNFERVGKNQMHDDVHHFVWDLKGNVWAGHDGGVSFSSDDGKNWSDKDRGIGVANVFGLDVSQVEEEIVLYGGYDTGGNLLTDSIWKHITWGDGFETIVDHSDPNVLYATKQNGYINRSDNKGLDFENNVTSSTTKTEWHTWIRQHPTKPDMIFCSGTNLVRSTDKGESWETILAAEDLPGKMVTTFRFFLSDHHPDVIYAYVLDETKVSPQILVTYNSSASRAEDVRWYPVQDIPKKGWIVALTVDKEDPSQFWMAYKSSEPESKIFRYNGDRYIDVTANLGWTVVGAMIQDHQSEERLFVGTNHGVFTRNKHEREWTLLEGLPGTWVRSLSINYQTQMLYAGSFGRGVWKAPLFEK